MTNDYIGTVAERFESQFNQDFAGGYTGADRIEGVITDHIPSRFPARLFLWVVARSPRRPSQRELLDAMSAIEYTALHHFLHSIPRADGEFIPEVERSPYSSDPIAAILDGDLLQAKAFSRLNEISDDPVRCRRCYGVFVADSVRQYEQHHGSNGAQSSAFVSSCAARVGAILGGYDRETIDRVYRSTRSLEGLIPMKTPTGWTGETSMKLLRAELSRIERSFADTSNDGPGTEYLLSDWRDAEEVR